VLDPTYIAELNDSENISTVNGKPDNLKNVHEYNICSVHNGPSEDNGRTYSFSFSSTSIAIMKPMTETIYFTATMRKQKHTGKSLHRCGMVVLWKILLF